METKNKTLTELVEVFSMDSLFYYDYGELKAKIINKCRKITRRGNTFQLIKDSEKNNFILDEFENNTKEIINSHIFWEYEYKFNGLCQKKPTPFAETKKIDISVNELYDLKHLIVNKLVETKLVPFVDNESEINTGNVIKNIFEEFFNVKLE